MITFIVKDKDQELLNYFWAPLQIKYPMYEYLFVDEQQFKETIMKAKHNILFITDIDAVPTYETMVLLEEKKKKNEVLLPKWYEGYGNPPEDLNSFSVLKEQFILVEFNLKQYIEKWKPVIHKAGTMYHIE